MMDLHAFLRDLTAGQDLREIADKLGVTVLTVRRWQWRRGFHVPSRRTLDRVFAAYAVGLADQRAAIAAREHMLSPEQTTARLEAQVANRRGILDAAEKRAAAAELIAERATDRARRARTNRDGARRKLEDAEAALRFARQGVGDAA